jgi:outer membrane protein
MKKLIIFLFIIAGFSAQSQVKKWTLKECVDYAIENNISIKQAELDLDQSELNKNDAVGNFLPNLNARASQSWNNGLAQNPVTFDAVTSTTQNLSGGISSSIDLYTGLTRLNELNKSKMAILASKYQLENMQQDISLFVANSFLQILFNKEQIKVLTSQIDVTRNELLQTQDLIEAGVIPEGDLLEVQANLAGQEQQLVAAENALYISKVSLAQLLLITDYDNFDIVDMDYLAPLSDILNQPAEVIFGRAKETRKEILIAETNAKIAEYDLKIARGNLQPSLTGNYSFSSNYFRSDLFDTDDFETQMTDNKQHNYFLQLNIPIFNRFSGKNNIKRNKLNVERAKYQVEQEKLDLQTTVYQAYNDAKGAGKAYEAAVKTLNARELAYNFSQERYNVGLLNAFDFSQSQNQYVAAQSEVVRTKYDFIFKLKVLELYFGIPITDIN